MPTQETALPVTQATVDALFEEEFEDFSFGALDQVIRNAVSELEERGYTSKIDTKGISQQLLSGFTTVRNVATEALDDPVAEEFVVAVHELINAYVSDTRELFRAYLAQALEVVRDTRAEELSKPSIMTIEIDVDKEDLSDVLEALGFYS